MIPLPWSTLAARAGVPVAVALAGGAVGAVGVSPRRPTAALAVHFAAGAFLAAALLHLLPEAAQQSGWPGVLLAAAAGWALCSGLARWAGDFCPACATSHILPHPGRNGLGPMPVGTPLLLVVAIHSVLDGVALAGAGGPREAGLLSLAVLVHKLPEGLAVAAVCRARGRSPLASFGVTTLVEGATFIGLILGVSLGASQGTAFGLCLGAVSGSFLYLAMLTFAGNREAAHPVLNAGTAAAGVLLIAAARAALGAGR